MAFVLAVGFGYPDNDAIFLIEKSFSVVHLAPEQHVLSESNWSLLRGHAPAAPLFRIGTNAVAMRLLSISCALVGLSKAY